VDIIVTSDTAGFRACMLMVRIGLGLGLEFVILTARRVQRVNMHYSEKFRGNRSKQCQYMAIYHFFQYGGRRPSWICCTRVSTTHGEHLAVFVVVQNLMKIDAIVSIICKFLDFFSLAEKCPFSPPKLGVLGI